MPLPWLIGAIGVAAASAAASAGKSTYYQETHTKNVVVDAPSRPDVQGSAEHETQVDGPFIELGRRVEMARVLQRMTQDGCASAANISRTALRNLEDGKDARLSTLLAVSNALSVPIAALFEGIQPELERNLANFAESPKETTTCIKRSGSGLGW